MFHGSHVLMHWSRTQTTIALSSGEAELNASLKGGAELLGLRELFREWPRPLVLELQGDSSACKGTVNRLGSGRIKHLEVKQLWIQDKVKEKEIEFKKIPREISSADALTKHWGPDGLKHFASSNFVMPEAEVSRRSSSENERQSRAPARPPSEGGCSYIASPIVRG